MINFVEEYLVRRPILLVVIAVSYAAIFVSSMSAGQGFGRTGGSGGARNDGQQKYDPYQEETISGQVITVKDIDVNNGKITGVGLELRTMSQTINVYLGPHIYVDLENVKIVAGDVVDIRGVRAAYHGQDVFLAGEVRRGYDVLKLRDQNGVPLWAGTRQGRSRQY
jgi:hypothetical protein